jgi:uncharacterized iron-regulated membrane protein
MKKIFRYGHRWMGLIFGIFITVVCLTGAVLVWQDELNSFANRTTPQGEMLDAETLIERVQQQQPEGLTLVALHMPADDHHVAEAQFAELGRQTLAVNPYTGELDDKAGSSLVAFTKKLHRWLLMPPADTHGGMSVGRVIVGCTAIALTLLLISGIILWWPKNGKMLRQRLVPHMRQGNRRRVYDLHVVLGIYAVVFLLAMSLTGPIFSFPWYRTAATALAGGEASEMHLHQGGGHDGGNIEQQVMVVMPQQDGQPHGKVPVQMRFTQWHTGSIGGIVTKVLWCLAALIGASLPITGFLIYRHRGRPSGSRKDN